MTLTRPRRRQLILSWIGIGLAWAASFTFVLVLLTEWMMLAGPATTVGALGAGAIVTRRLTAQQRRASITVGDLRAFRPKRG